MARTLEEIARQVQREAAVLEREETAGPDDQPDTGRRWRWTDQGILRNEDELVIGIGEPGQFDTDGQRFPLTDLFIWLGTVADDMPGLGVEPRGRLTLTAVWVPEAEGMVEDEDEEWAPDTDLLDRRADRRAEELDEDDAE